MDATIGIPPEVTAETAPFWEAAKEGRLLVQHCNTCGAESFPPRSICRACHGRETGFAEVTSSGTVYSFTVNYQHWLPQLEVPFVLVLVEFADHPGVRIAGRLRDCEPDKVGIGMQVEVGFQPGPDGFAIPSFTPTAGVER